MAIQKKADQLLYKGRGPLDPKSVVKTYEELTNTNTWTYDETLVAYNGMIVAVYLDKVSASNNGIYYLFDPAVTSALKKPDVTNEANWHKFAELSELDNIDAKLANYVTAEVLDVTLVDYAKTSDTVSSEVFAEFRETNDAAILEVATEVSKKADLVVLNDYYKTQEAETKFTELAGSLDSLSADLVNKADKTTVYTKSEVNDIRASLEAQLATKADKATTYTKEEVNALLTDIEGGSSESAASVSRELAAYVSRNDAAVLSLETRVGTKAIGDTPSTGIFALVDSTETRVTEVADLLTTKLAGISTTVVDAIDEAVKTIPKLEVATEERLGGIKSSSDDNSVSVDADGNASVKVVNVNSLKQTTGDILILDGGDVARNTEG
jgi:hypothetical protein